MTSVLNNTYEVSFIPQVDVIVNSTTPSLDLGSSSGLAASLLKAGGKQIQKELDKNYPKGISPGDIAETSGGSLNCNAVFHGTLPYWYSKKKLNKKPEEASISAAMS